MPITRAQYERNSSASAIVSRKLTIRLAAMKPNSHRKSITRRNSTVPTFSKPAMSHAAARTSITDVRRGSE